MMANKSFIFSAIFRAIDQVTAPVRGITRGVTAMTAPVRRAGLAFRGMADAGGLGRITGAVGGLGNSVKGLSGHLSGAAGTIGLIGGAASIAGITKLTTGYAHAGDTIAKFSRQAGLTAEAYQELKFAADRSGVEAQEFDTSMEQLNKRLGEAKAGTGSLVTFLDKTSPALLRQLKAAKSNEEAFALLTTAMERIDDPSKRAALAAAAFGRGGLAMTNMMAGGGAEIDKLRKEAQRLGLVIGTDKANEAEGFVDSITNLTAASQGLSNVLGGRLLPVIQPLIDGLTEWIVVNRELITTNVTGVVQRFAEFLGGVDWAGVWGSIERVSYAVGDFVDMIGGLDNALIGLVAVANGPLILALVSVGGALVKLGAVFLATPIGAAVAGIAAAAYLIYDNWGGIVAFFEEKIAGVSAAFDNGFINGVLRVLEEFNPVTIMAEAMNGLIAYLTGFDLGAIISNKIMGAVSMLPDWARRLMGIGDGNLAVQATGAPAGQPGGTAAIAGAGRGRDAEANVTVRFENAPRGTRVESETKGAGLDLGVETGTQLVGAML